MKAIYEPKGRALEYAELACNLYRGCSHSCSYCFGPSVLRMDREIFHKHPVPRPGIIEALRRDAETLRGDPRTVLLSFTSDIYQPIDDEHRLARKAICALKDAGLNFEVLTKGGMRAARDFDLYESGDRFATTLTLINFLSSIEREPGAAHPVERIGAIRQAKKRGITTWVSLEPVLDPALSLELIRLTHDVVDKFKVGKWNHDKRAKDIDWKRFGNEAVELLERLGKDYYIKDDLRREMEETE